ncbi:MAG TPA: hypothetical protein VFH51_01955 [Myxococcota bacterium]|nr:hypothetical protein [Myxococcota bacterium]
MAENENKPKRLAVLETEAHAEEVVAQVRGKDMLDGHYPVWGKGHGTLPDPMLHGRAWESHRPMEAEPPAPPVVALPSQWQKNGRICMLRGPGKHAIMVLQARRSY